MLKCLYYETKTKTDMSLFSHHVAFKQIDPLGDGLREEIVAEQNEDDAITLSENVNEDELTHFWQSVEADIEQDPEWFSFTEDN